MSLMSDDDKPESGQILDVMEILSEKLSSLVAISDETIGMPS